MSNGKLLAMMLNPVSKYFRQHIKRESSYFREVKHRELKKIEDHTSKFFAVKTKYYLGIDGEKIFDSHNPQTASLYVIIGRRK
jgi:hypothetical protein